MKAQHFKHTSVLLLMIALAMPLAVFGQGITTGGLTGVIVDPQGAVVPAAQVSITNLGTNVTQTTQTNATGVFNFKNLPIGTYSVVVKATGFNELKLDNVLVQVGRDTNLGSRTLALTGTTQEVTVEASTPQIEATTSQVSSVYSTQQLADLPVGATLDDVALLSAGVANTHDASFGNSNNSNAVNLSVNGQRGRSNNFQIDGQNNNDNSVTGPAFFFGNQDAVQEVQVITNNFSAEYGRNMGGVVNYITKSGSNTFHGTAYEFYQGSWLSSLKNQEKSPLLGFCTPNQNPSTDNCTATVVPRVVDNRWGGTFGGPIIRNRIWFFGSTNWERQRQGASPSSSGTALTPTPAGLATLQAALPGNNAVAVISQSGPFGIKTGNPMVVPGTTQIVDVTTPTGGTLPVEFASVQRLIPSLFNDKEATGRVDWQPTDKDRIFGRYLFQDQLFTGQPDFSNPNQSIAAGSFFDGPGRTQEAGIDYTRTFTSAFVNQFRFSYFRSRFGFEGGSFPDCLQTNLTNCPANINFSGANLLSFGRATNLPQGRLVNNSQWQDNINWVHGTHGFKFGGEYDRQRSPNVFLPNVNGQFTYSRGTTCPASSSAAVGCVFGKFLADNGTLNLADGPSSLNFKEQDAAVYFQDDWRIRPNLTLNLGIRWEFFQQAINLLNDLTVARESGPGAFWNTALPLSARTVAAVPQDRNNFGPAVGFAWQPYGNTNTVIRGGYRINYDPAFYNIFLNVGTSAPVVNLGSVACNGNCLPADIIGTNVRSADLGLIPRGLDPRSRNETIVASNFHNPYAQNWSFGVQQQFTRNIVGELRYAGNHTIGNFQTIDGNPDISALATDFPQFLPAGITPCTDPTQPGGSGVNPVTNDPQQHVSCSNRVVRERANSAFSIYHGLQTRMNFQNLHGFTGGVSYTFSKTIDNVTDIFSTFGGGNTVAFSQNPFDSNRAERAISGLSYPHVFSAYVNFQTPWFTGQHGLIGRLLGGYEIGLVYSYNSGQPLTPAQGLASPYCDASFNAAFNSGVDSCRPILGNPAAPLSSVGQYQPDGSLVNFATGDPVAASDVHWIFNDQTAAQVLGNPFPGVGRNTVRSQTYNNLDASAFKNFKFTERLSFQLQAVAKNVLNRQYRGAFDPFVDDFSTDPTANSFMNNFFANSNHREVTLGGKIIF